MNRRWAACGAFAAGIAVAAGAFGAHGLKDALSAARLDVWEKAVRYQAFHALALFLVAFWPAAGAERLLRTAGAAFLAGIVLFSGSLYALAITDAKAWGAVTPFGGVAFMVGWSALAAAALRRD